MNTDHYISQIEDSDLPTETIEAASDALGFVQSFHDLLADWGLVKSDEIDIVVLEKAFDGFIAELSAAGIFLATFKESVNKLRESADKSEAEGAPSLIVHGYRKLADRVQKTQKKLMK